MNNNNFEDVKTYKGHSIINEKVINKKILEDYSEYILYDRKIFKINTKQTNYYTNKGENVQIYKCKNARKYEKERLKGGLGEFCSAKIKKIIISKNKNEFLYEIINNHSIDCLDIKKYIRENNDNPIKEITHFKKESFEILNKIFI